MAQMDALSRLWAPAVAGPALGLVLRVLLGLVLFWPALGWSQFFGLDILPGKIPAQSVPVDRVRVPLKNQEIEGEIFFEQQPSFDLAPITAPPTPGLYAVVYSRDTPRERELVAQLSNYWAGPGRLQASARLDIVVASARDRNLARARLYDYLLDRHPTATICLDALVCDVLQELYPAQKSVRGHIRVLFDQEASAPSAAAAADPAVDPGADPGAGRILFYWPDTLAFFNQTLEALILPAARSSHAIYVFADAEKQSQRLFAAHWRALRDQHNLPVTLFAWPPSQALGGFVELVRSTSRPTLWVLSDHAELAEHVALLDFYQQPYVTTRFHDLMPGDGTLAPFTWSPLFHIERVDFLPAAWLAAALLSVGAPSRDGALEAIPGVWAPAPSRRRVFVNMSQMLKFGLRPPLFSAEEGYFYQW